MTESNIVLSQSEYEQLLEEIRELQARITELTALRDDLVYHVCPALSAEYEEKIVSLERELIAANMYLREKQRILPTRKPKRRLKRNSGNMRMT